MSVAPGRIEIVRFSTWERSVPELLEASGLIDALSSAGTVLIKPNLVNTTPPPVTTPVGLVEAVVEFIKTLAPRVTVVIGEGTASRDHNTFQVFESLGYTDLARRKGVDLVDLNEEELVRLNNPRLKRWPEIYLPRIALETFLLSIPVLKAHTLATVTLTMKNMLGLAPPSHYQQRGHWKKSAFHTDIHNAILDLNRYRTPDFTLLDATAGLVESHLGGRVFDPPLGILAASFDPVAVDAYGAWLLGKDWRSIPHIQMAHKELGVAHSLA